MKWDTNVFLMRKKLLKCPTDTERDPLAKVESDVVLGVVASTE